MWLHTTIYILGTNTEALIQGFLLNTFIQTPQSFKKKKKTCREFHSTASRLTWWLERENGQKERERENGLISNWHSSPNAKSVMKRVIKLYFTVYFQNTVNAIFSERLWVTPYITRYDLVWSAHLTKNTFPKLKSG